MITRRKPLHGFIAVVVFLLCTTAFAVPPPPKRTINKLSRPDDPVQIIAVKLKGKAIAFGKPFRGQNDWPGTLSFVIKNTSAKTVSWVRVALTFQKEKGGLRLKDPATYGIGRWDEDKLRGGGPPLKPGETAEVIFSMEQYRNTRELLNDMDFPKSIAQLEVSADQVIFADQPELMWIEGTMNEFQSPTGWRPVKP